MKLDLTWEPPPWGPTFTVLGDAMQTSKGRKQPILLWGSLQLALGILLGSVIFFLKDRKYLSIKRGDWTAHVGQKCGVSKWGDEHPRTVVYMGRNVNIPLEYTILFLKLWGKTKR